MRYISDKVKEGFKKYKYNSKDTSPLANYVMHPFWNWLVEFFPLWIAPNLMTFVGFLFSVANFLMLAYYDPEFKAVSVEFPKYAKIPNFVWLICSIFNFLSHTLDGTDGKQARRTGTSGPIGELFDHGCDSWAAIFLPACLYSVFGKGMFGAEPIDTLYTVWVIMGAFYMSHWEKYNTGVLYLPWGYDISQNSMTLLYLLTFLFTSDVWQNYFWGTNLTYGFLTRLVVHISFWLMSLPATLWNIYQSYSDKSGHMLSAKECLLPLMPIVTLAGSSILWAHYSPTKVLENHTRIFFLFVGTAFSNTACRLIVAQMSSTRADWVNPLGGAYSVLVALILLLPHHLAAYESLCLHVMTGVFVVLHIMYAVLVINEMLDFFGLRAFKIIPKQWRTDLSKSQ